MSLALGYAPVDRAGCMRGEASPGGCGWHRVRDGMNGASGVAATRRVAWGNGEVRRAGG